MEKLDLIGKTYGYWKVEAFSHTQKGKTYWDVTCKCGIKRKVPGATLLYGSSKSCGCYSVEKLVQRSKRKWIEIKNEDGSYNIPLSKNMYAVIDAIDLDNIKKHSWYSLSTSNGIYAASNINRKVILMHRMILEVKYDEKVDHIDHNRLNNKRSNIRVCSTQENSMNTTLRKDNKSGYRGVHYRPEQNKYIAQLNYKGKNIHLGCFSTAEEAAMLSESKRKELFGNFFNPLLTRR